MSEEEKPVCRLCGQPVDGDDDKIADAYSGATRHAASHMHPSRCITALRAALDQERAKVERLKNYAGHFPECYYDEWPCTCGLSALLSGRGEGGG